MRHVHHIARRDRGNRRTNAVPVELVMLDVNNEFQAGNCVLPIAQTAL
jgi:hypothetical protein